MPKIVIDGKHLTIEDIVLVARGTDDGHNGRHYPVVELSQGARERIKASRKVVEELVAKKIPCYGITTGFGQFQNKLIGPENCEKLQLNIIRSHAVGVGSNLPVEVVRAAMLLRANTLSRGLSGVREELIEQLIAFINSQIYPVIPEQGSVGSSGDLCPLAHMSLALVGEGEVTYKDDPTPMPAIEALKLAGFNPINLSYKEGLALTNGTPVMTALAVLTWHDANILVKSADIACAMSTESLLGNTSHLKPYIHEARPYKGQLESAAFMRRLLQGSELVDVGREYEYRREVVQNSYSIRCAPQVHGAARQALDHVLQTLLIEINAATDNPLISVDECFGFSGGNFHGEPIGLAMDYLKCAVAELASISERRIAKLLDSNHNEGLPECLTPKFDANGQKQEEGLNSGFMLVQYAAAALVSENKTLCHPATVDSIPTGSDSEDHVSMGTIAARHARRVVENVKNVIAMEFMTAAQALEIRMGITGRKMSPTTEKVFKRIREDVQMFFEDRFFSPDVKDITKLVGSGKLVSLVEE